MRSEQGVELAYLIIERLRAAKLLEVLRDATDVGAAGELHLTVVLGAGSSTRVELPHHLLRYLLGSRVLWLEVDNYRSELDRQLRDQFGVIIEDQDR